MKSLLSKTTSTLPGSLSFTDGRLNVVGTSGVFDIYEDVRISGSVKIALGETQLFAIENYDSFSTYSATCDIGEVSIVDNIITYNATTAGNGVITVMENNIATVINTTVEDPLLSG
jgi:hypothetical protein